MLYFCFIIWREINKRTRDLNEKCSVRKIDL